MSTTMYPIPDELFADFADDMEQAFRIRREAESLAAQADGIQNNAERRMLRKMGIPGGPNVTINPGTKSIEVESPDAVAPVEPQP